MSFKRDNLFVCCHSLIFLFILQSDEDIDQLKESSNGESAQGASIGDVINYSMQCLLFKRV